VRLGSQVGSGILRDLSGQPGDALARRLEDDDVRHALAGMAALYGQDVGHDMIP
jgi:hypothetical protein